MFLIVLNEILLNHVFTYFFNYKQVTFTFFTLFLYFISFFIVKCHWAKWKWRYTNFFIVVVIIIIIIIIIIVIIIIIIMSSVINNAD